MDAGALAVLADIEIPAPPEWHVGLYAAAAALILAAAGAIAWRTLRRRDRAAIPSPASPSAADEALARLEVLQGAWRSGAVDDREAGYRLCALLRIGLALPALDPAAPPAGIARAEEWRHCLQRLQRLRYAAAAEGLAPESFDLARTWLASARPQTRPAHA